ncbi:MAG: BON domain-containing protein [Variovorax sp.]
MRTVLLRLAAAVLVVSVGACSDGSGDRTTGQQLDSALEQTRDAAATAARKAGELADKAGDKTKAYVNSPEAKQDAAAAKEAVRNAGRALESTAEDAAITASVSAALARDVELSATRIDVDTEAGAVRLSGPAPTAEAKVRASDIAKAVNGVGSVDNRLEVRTASARSP